MHLPVFEIIFKVERDFLVYFAGGHDTLIIMSSNFFRFKGALSPALEKHFPKHITIAQ